MLLTTGVDKTDSRRRIKDISKSTVRGVAGLSIVEGRETRDAADAEDWDQVKPGAEAQQRVKWQARMEVMRGGRQREMANEGAQGEL